MDYGFGLFFQATVDEFLTTGLPRDGIDGGANQGMNELMGDAYELVIARAPFPYVDGPLAPVVIGAARTVDQTYLDSVLANSFDVLDQGWTFFCCLDELLAELSSEVSHGGLFRVSGRVVRRININSGGCTGANINSIPIFPPGKAPKTPRRAQMEVLAKRPGFRALD